MKDDFQKEFSEKDIDMILDEYRNNTPSDSEYTGMPNQQKKFVVHIDDNLMDSVPEDEHSQTPGGIYFSNYKRNNKTESNLHYKSVTPNPSGEMTDKSVSNKIAKNPNKSRLKSESIKKNVEKIGGKTAVKFLAFIIICTILLSYIGITCVDDMLAINRSEENIVVEVPENSDYKDLIKLFKENGLIKRTTFCQLFTKFRHFDKEEYLSGSYYLNSKMGVEGMLKDVMVEPVSAESISISIPEGWTITQIAEKLEKYDVCSSSKFLSAVKNANYSYDFISEINNDSTRYMKLEGYLFPDTYEFYVDADVNYVITKFLDNFSNKWPAEYDARAKTLGFSKDEILRIASIIQKEAANTSQMKTISSVIHNRLKNKSNYPALQCDSTSTYINNYVTPTVGEVQGKYYYNYYDTYSILGLTPGPICNPGLEAIKAALYPEDTEYFYFAHDKSGRIYLAKTNREHNNNIVMIAQANSNSN